MTNWTKHTGTGTGMPGKLAQAQIVEVEWPFKATPGRHSHRVSSLNWIDDTFYYRPALDPDGLPYVSSKGLEPWAEYVSVDDAEVTQFEVKPEFFGNCVWDSPPDMSFTNSARAPDTHAVPGPPEKSLARVWRS